MSLKKSFLIIDALEKTIIDIFLIFFNEFNKNILNEAKYCELM
jgi:hypothetical protein